MSNKKTNRSNSNFQWKYFKEFEHLMVLFTYKKSYKFVIRTVVFERERERENE